MRMRVVCPAHRAGVPSPRGCGPRASLALSTLTVIPSAAPVPSLSYRLCSTHRSLRTKRRLDPAGSPASRPKLSSLLVEGCLLCA
eukprot:gene11087-biopygen165